MARARGDERIRLMRCISPLGPGEIERQFGSVNRAIDSQRFALEQVYVRRRGHGPNALGQQLRLARHIRRRQIQILHSCDFCSNGLAIPAAWVAGVPVIVASIQDRGPRLTARERHLQRMVCRLADCVVVNADSTRAWLAANGFASSNTVVIRNGVDLSTFARPRPADARRDLGIREDTPFVVMRARFEVNRGIEDFIDAAAILSWKFSAVRCLVVRSDHPLGRGTSSGETAYRRTIVSRIDRLGLSDIVQLTDDRVDVVGLLAHTAISVIPPPDEEPSNLIVESMAAGVPVVATRVDGAPEAIEDGETGLLVSVGDPQGLAEAIGRLLREPNLAAHLGAAGRQAALERFGMDRTVHATERLYVDLLVQKATHPEWRGRIGLSQSAFEALTGTHYG
jgi:L-malate glycosyltransferase